VTKLSFASKDLSFVGPRSCFAKRFDRLGIIAEEEVPNIKDIAFSHDVQLQNVREMF
jgi:hypothetical protein